MTRTQNTSDVWHVWCLRRTLTFSHQPFCVLCKTHRQPNLELKKKETNKITAAQTSFACFSPQTQVMQTQKKKTNAEAPKTQEEWGMEMIEATQQQKQQLKVMRRMESKDRDRGKNTKKQKSVPSQSPCYH